MNFHRTTGLLLLVGAALAVAATPLRAAPDAPPVEARTLGLSSVRGTLLSLDAEGARIRSSSGGPERALALEDLVFLRMPARPAPPSREALRFRFHLVGGERLVARLVDAQEDILTLESAALGRVPLAFDAIQTVEAYPTDAGPCHDLASRHPRPESDDAAYDGNGDEYRGAVLEATVQHLVIESARGRERTLPWSALSVLHLQTTALAAPKGAQPEIELQDGSLLPTAGPVTYADGGFRFALRSLPKVALRAHAATVRAVRWSGGRFVYASELPFRSERRPYHVDAEGVTDPAYLDRWFGTRVARRASGCPLRIGGETFRHGFGVNSHSLVTIELGGAFASFRTSFGIDDEVLAETGAGGKRGNVDARILADGKVLWEAKGIVGGAEAVGVGPLDVRGVQRLVLEVGFGADLMILDRADWGDPILVRK